MPFIKRFMAPMHVHSWRSVLSMNLGEPSPHPDPLPSHPMGAEREQEEDINCCSMPSRCGRFMAPMQAKNRVEALHEPQGKERGSLWFMFAPTSPPHEPCGPSPHPDPLPSHPMGAEREQQEDARCSSNTRQQATGSRIQCAKRIGEFSPWPSPPGRGNGERTFTVI